MGAAKKYPVNASGVRDGLAWEMLASSWCNVVGFASCFQTAYATAVEFSKLNISLNIRPVKILLQLSSEGMGKVSDGYEFDL